MLGSRRARERQPPARLGSGPGKLRSGFGGSLRQCQCGVVFEAGNHFLTHFERLKGGECLAQSLPCGYRIISLEVDFAEPALRIGFTVAVGRIAANG